MITRLPLATLLLGVLFLTGCQSRDPVTLVEPLVARFYLEARPGEAGQRLAMPVSKIGLTVNPKPVLVEYDITNVELARVELGWCLLFHFSNAAARDLYRLSVTNAGRRLVLAFNGSPAGVRRIDQALGEGSVLIFVEVPDGELAAIADRLRRTSAGIAAASPQH